MIWGMLFQPSVLFAASGALAIQLIILSELRNVPRAQRPDFGDWLYWLPFLLNPAAGILLVLAHTVGQGEIAPLLSLNIGASAPLILRSMAEVNPFDAPDVEEDA